MNQARQTFYTKFIDENSTDHKRLFRATKQLLAKKEELSFPNYQDKSKLADDIGGFFIRKINRIRSDIDSVDIDLSFRNALPPDQEVDDAHAFHSFQQFSENAVSALIRKSAKKSCPLDPMPTSLVVGCLEVLLCDGMCHSLNLPHESQISVCFRMTVPLSHSTAEHHDVL